MDLQRTVLRHLAGRIETEFREMPGLQLTLWQASRLWRLEADECEAILTALVQARVLRRTGNVFARRES